jgi:hypothetical protein
MATATQTRRSSTEPTPLYALVGATDLAVEGVRHAIADAAHRQSEVQAQVQQQFEQIQSELTTRGTEGQKRLGEPKRLQAEIEHVPGLVIGRTLEVAAKAETRYEELAERGKSLIERLRAQKATQDLIDQGKATISRTKAAVTTARHAAEDVAASARETLTVGKREAKAVAEVTTIATQAGAEATAEAAEATRKTARKRVARTRSATKSAATSARKTAAAAVEAAEAGAEKIGD